MNKTERNMALLLRLAVPGKVAFIAIQHDDWCPGLEAESMLLCECDPVYVTYYPRPEDGDLNVVRGGHTAKDLEARELQEVAT